MLARKALLSFTFVALLGLAAACEQAPLGVDNEIAAAALTVPTGGIQKVIVCKDGPVGYNFPISVATTGLGSGSADVTLYNGGAFDLIADQCVDAAVTTDANKFVTVTETPPAGTEFYKVEVYNYSTFGGGTQTLKSTSTTDPLVTVGPFGNDNGQVVVYYNRRLPVTGCTLTQGYWKTHNVSFGGGASKKPDPAWDLLPAAEATPFYLSGQTWYEVFWTPVQGNAYYNLAHQFMAASLNVLAGASAPAAVTSALTAADVLFTTYTPAQVAGMDNKSSVVKEFKSLAGTLDDYNNGLIGPGHCGGPTDF